MRDDVLAQELQAVLRADASATSVPPVGELLSRSRRRRSQHRAGAVLGAVLVGVAGVAGTQLVGGGSDTSTMYVAPVDDELVLERGTDAGGPWRIVSSREDGYCIQHVEALGSGGSCQQAEPEDLTEGAIYVLEDGGEPVTIAVGPTPDVTAEVVVQLADGTLRTTSPVRHGERTLYVLRLPGEVRITEIQARDADGTVIGRHAGFPPPGPPVVAAPPPAPPGGPPGLEDPGARALVDQFRAYAAAPSPSLLAETPISPQVQLGLGTEVVTTLASTDLIASPEAWVLPVDGGAGGPVSALDALGRPGPVQVTAGPQPRCAAAPSSAPAGLEGAQWISVQPTVGGCGDWYTVDFFLVDGLVQAITVAYAQP